MDFNDEQVVWIAYTASNIVGLLLLIVSIKAPRLARLMFVLLFGWAAWINYTTSHQQPAVYLMYAEQSIGIYSKFINGWFKHHITGFISLIAIGQGFIALGMLLKGWLVKLACVGGILFLLAIAPLGIYSAFPFSLTVSLALFFILKKDKLQYLWQFQKRNAPDILKHS